MKKKSVKRFLQNILLAIELTIYIAYLHFDKVIFIGIIALDQYTKAQVIDTMRVGETIPIIQDIFHITYVINPGAAFGILPYQRVFFVTTGTLILLLAALYYAKLKKIDKVMRLGGMITAAGALANLIDRVRNGVVTDLFDCRFLNFPVFNVADIAIVLGTFIMIYVVMFQSEKLNGIKEVRQP